MPAQPPAEPGVAAVVVDPGGRITAADAGTEPLLGWPAGDLVGRGVDVLVADHETEPFATPAGGDLVVSARRRDGSAFPAHVTLTPQGEPDHAVRVTITGVPGPATSRVPAPTAPAIDAASVREVAHDLNNVISVMLLYSELIERAVQGRSMDQYLGEVRLAAQRGAELTGRLRSMAVGSGTAGHASVPPNRPRIDEEWLLSAIRRRAAAHAHRDHVGVVVVDDHRMFADGLVRLLGLEDGIDVLGVGGSGHEAVDLVEQLRPRVLLLDVDMPDGNGLVAAAEIKRRWPTTMVVMVTGSHDDSLLLRAIEIGCSGYLTKDRAAADLASAVRAVAAGEALIAPHQMERLLPRLSRQGSGVGADLTEHELAVLTLLARGATAPAIASDLFLELDTARVDIAGVLAKLQAHSTLEAVATAIREGVIHYNSPFG